jgi:hypothetical protein
LTYVNFSSFEVPRHRSLVNPAQGQPSVSRYGGMSRRAATAPPPTLAPPSVDGLAGGRSRARRRAGQQRRKNRAISTVIFVLVAGGVGAAAYAGWQFYGEEQTRNNTVGVPAGGDTPDEMIDELIDGPRWNGPGAPAFGVGENDPVVTAVP